MDRKSIEQSSKKQSNALPYQPTRFTHLNPALAIQNPQLHTPFQQSGNIIPQNSANQHLQPTNKKLFPRTHRRGNSEGVAVVVRKAQNKQNSSHKDIDPIQDGELRMKNIDEKLRQLEQRVFKAEEILLLTPNKGKDQTNFHNETVKIIDQITSQRFSQIDQSIQQILGQISATKSQLQAGNGVSMHRSELINIPKCSENPQLVLDIDQKLQSLYASVRNQFQTYFGSIQEKIKKLSAHKEYQQALNIEPEFFRTNRKYSGNPISFLYEEYIKQRENSDNVRNSFSVSDKEEEGGKIRINQITYYIDSEGFLLDHEGLYLVNSKNMQIKLSQRELRMLRKANVLANC